jgi:hypothetical protein
MLIAFVKTMMTGQDACVEVSKRYRKGIVTSAARHHAMT